MIDQVTPPPDAVAGSNTALTAFIAVVGVALLIIFISGGPRDGGRR